ncbi:hypothetical protein [Bacteroides sp. 51]|uniref:hypothetical protein n=1 Tax=Bacteroides sp. 51 TaxID=2302938 RepID=UPI001EF2C949|nr:hypothetical protein [Bacteroides sp. 51]NDV83593.1 hypothetical protein [Bacteroides sp. 51]
MKGLTRSGIQPLWTAALLIVLGSTAVKAQEKVEVSVGADMVSGYIWRGTDCGGVSIQPSISVARSGFSLTAWGSVGIDNDDTKEFDLTLGYNIGGFSVAVTDYWFNQDGDSMSQRYFNYRARGTHIFEATLGYDFGPIALSWNTNFAGNDYKENGNRAYSSYLEAVVPFKLGGFDFAAEVGMTPWEGAYSDGLNVTNVGLGVYKDIKITESFTLPAFAKITTNPFEDRTYFVFGGTLALPNF